MSNVNAVCFETGDKVDGTEPFREMLVEHEPDSKQKMPIYAHERCIAGSPNENNWKYANRHDAFNL